MDESAAEDQDQDDGEYKWWENFNEDDGIKWTSLQHSGVYFPPPYEPHGVKMKYDGKLRWFCIIVKINPNLGKPIELSPASEEVAGFFAQVLGTQYAENPTFCKNFFEDFKAVLKENDPV